MKADVIQVKTYGRTGSNLITNYFGNVGYTQLDHRNPEEVIQQVGYGKKVIVHDHSHDYIVPKVKNLSLCMFVKRRDAKQQILSMMVAKRFTFYHDMDETLGDAIRPEMTPFTLKKPLLLAETRAFNEWHHKASIALMNSEMPVLVIYYEDFVHDLDYFSFLHDRIGYKQIARTEIKNRVQPKDVIENYEEAKLWLSEWNLSTGII